MSTRTRFEKEAKGNLEMAYCRFSEIYNHGQIPLGHFVLSQFSTHFRTLGASPLPPPIPNQCWA